ncbi:hypothetical protein L1887_23303 [Cichorium endivia]|nr:hypothetical protein L1887_23303 [Cichorium endivia]
MWGMCGGNSESMEETKPKNPVDGGQILTILLSVHSSEFSHFAFTIRAGTSIKSEDAELISTSSCLTDLGELVTPSSS